MSFQLVSMDWKLGVAMSSSSCRSLNSPYVSLQLRIAESGGNIRLQTVEMTIPEFQVSRSFSLSLPLSMQARSQTNSSRQRVLTCSNYQYYT